MLETGNLCCVWDVSSSSKVGCGVIRNGSAAVTTLGIQLRYTKMSPSLSVVADNELKIVPTKTETVSERVRRLQAEAKQLAKDHVKSLSRAMVELEQLAAEIAEGGDAYAPGIREVARQLVEDLDSRVQTLEAIAART